MGTGHELIVLSYGLSTIMGVVLSGILWRHREKTGAVPMAVAAVGPVFWSGPLFMAAVVDSYALSAFLHRFLYVGVGISVLGAFLFVLEYTGREHLVTRRTIAVLSIEPIAVVALAFWNPSALFFESIAHDSTSITGVAIEWGIAFDVHLVYSYAITILGSAMILEFLYTSRALYRGQAAALFVGSIIPLSLNAVHVFSPIRADTTPIGFIITGILYSIAIVRYQLIDVTPIARDRVLDTVSEGVFVADRDDRLVDVNPEGRRFLGVDDRTRLVGRSVDSLFVAEPAVRELYHDLTTTADESSAEFAHDGSHYEVNVTPIDDGRDRHVGWLVLASDITDRKRREDRLEAQNERLDRQNERLDQFASLVSHDLRNPLTVASGYVDVTRETGDLSQLEEVDRSLDRMETIIEDVLTLTREGDADTEPAPVPLADVAGRAWNGVATEGASLSIEADATIVADEERTMRLLENLFRNSVEHSSTNTDSQARQNSVGHDVTADHGSKDASGGESNAGTSDGVAVTIGEITDSETRTLEGFYVADDGPGFSTDETDRIFEDGYTTGDNGTGLGLSIVAEIAAAHDWSVGATETERGGARFEFTGVETVSGERDQTPRLGAERYVND